MHCTELIFGTKMCRIRAASTWANSPGGLPQKAHYTQPKISLRHTAPDASSSCRVHYLFTAQDLIEINDDFLSLLFVRAITLFDQAIELSSKATHVEQGYHLTSSLLRVGIRAYVALQGYTPRWCVERALSDILKRCILIAHIKTLKSTLESDKLSFFSTNGTPVADQPSMHFTLPNKRTPRGGKASSKAPTKLTHQFLLTFFPKRARHLRRFPLARPNHSNHLARPPRLRISQLPSLSSYQQTEARAPCMAMASSGPYPRDLASSISSSPAAAFFPFPLPRMNPA